MAEWSKALVLGTSLFGGVGSNPIAAIILLINRSNVIACKSSRPLLVNLMLTECSILIFSKLS